MMLIALILNAVLIQYTAKQMVFNVQCIPDTTMTVTSMCIRYTQHSVLFVLPYTVYNII